jgi:hypothetical protein
MINLIIDILKADANIVAITTTSRIYPVSRLEGGVIPAIVVQLTGTDPADTHDTTSTMDDHTVQVTVIEDKPKDANALAVLVRAALDGYAGNSIAEIRFVNQATDVFEAVDLFTQTMVYSVKLHRDNVTIPTALADLGILNLDDISDVNVPAPTDGQALVYDADTSQWVAGDAASAIADLTDVALDEPLDREALVYDEASTSWINGGPAKVDFPVTNNYAGGIALGTVVAFNGEVQGDRPRVVPFSASSANDPKSVVGIASETMAYRAAGHVRSYGTIYGLNTNAYPVGTILYASTTAGQLTSTPPTAPNHRIAIAVVTRQHANTGRIFVRSYTPGYRLNNLSDVSASATPSGHVLTWDNSAGVWYPALPQGGYLPGGSPPPGGYTPAIFYRASDGTLAVDDDLTWVAGTNTLTTINVTGSGVVKGTNTYGARFATEAATNRALANATGVTVERYFTCTAEGNGESFNIQSNTPSAGNVIRRRIYYKNEAFEATDVNTWTLLHTFDNDTDYNDTATQWAATLEAQTYGKPPFTLALTWEDVPAYLGVLDTTPGAKIGVSIRKLRADYTGACMRVRRASNNNETDIGFDANGVLDTTALASFCTGTNCFVQTWYDQSGNGANLIQTVTSRQPQIYDSATGVILDDAGLLPALYFPGASGSSMVTTAGVTTFDAADRYVTVHSVYSWTGVNTLSYVWSGNGDRGFNTFHESSKQRILAAKGGVQYSLSSSANLATNTLNVRTDLIANTSLSIRKDGGAQGTAVAAAVDYAAMPTNMTMGSGGSGATTHQLQGKISEVIQYASTQDITGLYGAVEQNQIDFF